MMILTTAIGAFIGSFLVAVLMQRGPHEEQPLAKRIQLMHPREGDVVLVACEHKLSQQATAELTKQLNERLKPANVLLLAHGLSVLQAADYSPLAPAEAEALRQAWQKAYT